MKLQHLHDWRVTPAEAKEIQRGLADRVSRNNEVKSPRLIAGVDISRPNQQGIATGAVVVLSFPELDVVEVKLACQEIEFPYVPGLLSFREVPLTLAACQKLISIPDLFLIDGQGIAHPRRFGLASHLGLFLDQPTIGCAKSLLIGKHKPVGLTRGNSDEIRDMDETIGIALRTKTNVKPIYVSIGHKVDLNGASHWVMQCCRGYRMPEPTRLAHIAASGRMCEKEPV